VAICERCRDAAAVGPLQESLLDEKRLEHVLDGVAFLADSRRQIVDADRTATELVEDALQKLAVHDVETRAVDIEHLQGGIGDGARDMSRGANLGKIAHPTQKPVGDTRRAARAAGNLMRAGVVCERSNDPLGVELAGAAKNAAALAAGATEAQGLNAAGAAAGHIFAEVWRYAEGLGARPFGAFRLVFLPLSLPGIVNGCVLVFTMCLGFYITPILLGTPKDMMISQLISQQIEDLLAWGFASAIAVVLLACTLVLLGVYNRFAGLDRLWG